MSTITKFEEMEVWQIGRELCQFVFKITSKGNLAKDYTLQRQIRSSSGSTMDNIAEGFGRAGTSEFRQFLAISNGSANEVKSQLYRSFDQNYISKQEFNQGYELADKLSKKIGSFMNYLNNSPFKGEKFRKN